jgi:manganese-dependent inorganic pyrophosphatase
VPEHLPDLILKAEYYISGKPVTVNEESSVWEALELLQKENSKALPIVDRTGAYRSMLHYQGFARYIIANINFRKKSSFLLSLNNLAATIHAQPVTLFNGEEIKNPQSKLRGI